VKILVTGAAGQLGREAVLAFTAGGHDVTGIGRAELDLAGSADVADAISAHGADWVVNCAAYTQVDRAEQESSLAFAVNRDAAEAIARGAKQGGSRLLHVSTDFVFGGGQAIPYREDDPADALSVYGRSKREGELAVMNALPEALIMRTSWVYGVHGNNFVKTMLRLMGDRDEVRVVDDQVGTPSWTGDIADAMLALMDHGAAGTWHFSNEGVASWYDLAYEVLSAAGELGYRLQARRVCPISSAEWPSAARRPAYSVLSKTKIRPLLPQGIAHWRDGLRRMLRDNLP
jgi:dTDP-4-dehydrorhamnose reductase